MSIFKALLNMNDLERKQAIINFDFLTDSYNNLRELRKESDEIIKKYIDRAYVDDENVTEIAIPKDDATVFFNKMKELASLEESLFSRKESIAGETEFTYYTWFGPVNVTLELK